MTAARLEAFKTLYQLAVATHAITVGTLTTNVMLRTRLLRPRIALHRARPGFVAMTVLVSAAALGRLLGGNDHGGLLFAAGAWGLALLALFAMLLRFRQPDHPG